jgi:hypothetical protein
VEATNSGRQEWEEVHFLEDLLLRDIHKAVIFHIIIKDILLQVPAEHQGISVGIEVQMEDRELS